MFLNSIVYILTERSSLSNAGPLIYSPGRIAKGLIRAWKMPSQTSQCWNSSSLVCLQAVRLLMHPDNAPTAMESLAHMVDEVWYHAGDTSTDVSSLLKINQTSFFSCVSDVLVCLHVSWATFVSTFYKFWDFMLFDVQHNWHDRCIHKVAFLYAFSEETD